MEAYHLDGTCFGENFNYEIKTFLERRRLDDKYLAPGLDFSSQFNVQNNGKRKTGWNPQTSKKLLFDNFIEELNETHEIEQPDGSVKFLKGVQLIDDIGLLEEIIQWSENLNVDRITAAMGAYAYAHYLRTTYQWKTQFYGGKEQFKKDENREPIVRRTSFFKENRKRTFFRR